jgi:7-cyano-7-deazaguanine reductase
MRYGEKEIAEAKLERWENPAKERDYIIELSFPEFTCLCPRSGYPDFATIKVTYVPNQWIVELKSIKLYLNSYRNRYISHEEAANKIYSDLHELLQPKMLELVADFNPRGNLHTVVKIGFCNPEDLQQSR